MGLDIAYDFTITRAAVMSPGNASLLSAILQVMLVISLVLCKFQV